MDYIAQCEEIIESTRIHISTLKPSEWYEKNMVMPLGSAFPGPYRYKKSPYLREIVDCFGKDHPARIIAIMKGAQIGVSAGVLTAGVGYIIAEHPGNILFLTGHSDLSEEAILKLDVMIDACGIRPLIRPSVLRKKNARTGDTNKSKEFAGGTLIGGSATNHNLLRQRDIMYAIIDDTDAAKKASKDAGDTTSLISQRTAAYATKSKQIYCSTPQLKGQSIIEEMFEGGDKRYYHIPCPHCEEKIVWFWEVPMRNSPAEKGGITWKLDNNGRLIEDSVGYICQCCGQFFNDRDKQNMLESGKWIPTAIPSKTGYYSYHVSALYAPVGMFTWKHYVEEWLKANPPNGDQDVAKQKTFVNVVLGQTFEEEIVENKASELQKNQRAYKPATVPESLSIKDGNGRIVMLTLGCDLNGKEDDARLDWEVVAWSESGASYAVMHGSIGTFIPREGEFKGNRERWTYRPGAPRSVWPVLTDILGQTFVFDTGRKMNIMVSGIDSGYMTDYVYDYVDHSNHNLFALKGDTTNKYTPFQRDARNAKVSKERANMFILESNLIKDELSNHMRLKWDQQQDERQPAWFMNFPMSEDGLFQFTNYFAHFEAEHRVTATNQHGQPVGNRWEKKDSTVQNHLWDCRCYNIAVRDIFSEKICRSVKITNSTWTDFVGLVLRQFKQ